MRGIVPVAREVDKLAGEIVNNEAFWKSAMGSAKIFKSTTIDNFGARDADGRKVFFMKATSVAESNGITLKVTQLQDMHPTPGMTYGVTCTALADKFAAEEQDFAAIMTSFTPSAGMIVSWTGVPLSVAAVRADAQRATRDGTAMGVLRTMGRR